MAPDRWTEPQRLLFSDGKRHEPTGAESEQDPQSTFLRAARQAYQARLDRLAAERAAEESKRGATGQSVSAATGNVPEAAPEPSPPPATAQPSPEPEPTSSPPPQPPHRIPTRPRVDALGLPIRSARGFLGPEYG